MSGGHGENCYLKCLDVLKLVCVPLFDLLVLPCCEEQMSLGNKLEEHDAAKRKQRKEIMRQSRLRSISNKETQERILHNNTFKIKLGKK